MNNFDNNVDNFGEINNENVVKDKQMEIDLGKEMNDVSLKGVESNNDKPIVKYLYTCNSNCIEWKRLKYILEPCKNHIFNLQIVNLKEII